jgi:hypothetical protein
VVNENTRNPKRVRHLPRLKPPTASYHLRTWQTALLSRGAIFAFVELEWLTTLRLRHVVCPSSYVPIDKDTHPFVMSLLLWISLFLTQLPLCHEVVQLGAISQKCYNTFFTDFNFTGTCFLSCFRMWFLLILATNFEVFQRCFRRLLYPCCAAVYVAQ